jgi:hypothetical protein
MAFGFLEVKVRRSSCGGTGTCWGYGGPDWIGEDKASVCTSCGGTGEVDKLVSPKWADLVIWSLFVIMVGTSLAVSIWVIMHGISR